MRAFLALSVIFATSPTLAVTEPSTGALTIPCGATLLGPITVEDKLSGVVMLRVPARQMLDVACAPDGAPLEWRGGPDGLVIRAR